MSEALMDGLPQPYEPKPINWNALELQSQRPADLPTVRAIIAKFEKAGVPCTSFTRALIVLGGLDFCPYDQENPITTNTDGTKSFNWTKNNQARINFENARSFINQHLIDRRPDLLRFAFIVERQNSTLKIPPLKKLKELAAKENWDLVYWFNWTEQNFANPKYQETHDKVQLQLIWTTDIPKLTSDAINFAKVKDLIKTGEMSYQVCQKAINIDKKTKSRRWVVTRLAPATAFSLIAAKNILRRPKPSPTQGKSPEEIAQAEGIRLSSELGTRLCEMFDPVPIDHPEKIEVIQPSDRPAFDIPPQEVGDYFKEDGQERLTDGLIGLYYQGLIEFSDETAKEFLPPPPFFPNA